MQGGDLTVDVYRILDEERLLDTARKFTNGHSGNLELWLREYMRVDYRYPLERKFLVLLLSKIDYAMLNDMIKSENSA